MADTKRNSAQAKGFTADEKAAMRERAREMKVSQDAAAGEADCLAKIAEMEGEDRVIAERVHALITKSAPGLNPRTWYGMPAYYKDGKVLCFFQPASKFKARYATIGFDESAKLDDGSMWPTSWALTKLDPDTEKRIVQLVKTAVG